MISKVSLIALCFICVIASSVESRAVDWDVAEEEYDYQTTALYESEELYAKKKKRSSKSKFDSFDDEEDAGFNKHDEELNFDMWGNDKRDERRKAPKKRLNRWESDVESEHLYDQNYEEKPSRRSLAKFDRIKLDDGGFRWLFDDSNIYRKRETKLSLNHSRNNNVNKSYEESEEGEAETSNSAGGSGDEISSSEAQSKEKVVELKDCALQGNKSDEAVNITKSEKAEESVATNDTIIQLENHGNSSETVTAMETTVWLETSASLGNCSEPEKIQQSEGTKSNENVLKSETK